MPRERAAYLLAAAATAAFAAGASPATAQTSPSPRAALVQALEFVRANDCGSAEPLLRQVIATQNFNVAARRLLGRCLLEAERWNDARPQFEALLELAPEDESALAGLRAAAAAGQKIESARQVEQIESRRTRAEQLRAQYEMRDAETMVVEGRNEDAEKALLDIMARRPEETIAGTRLAELYSSTRRFDEAARLFESLSLVPEAPARPILRAAQNHEWAGDDNAAVASYRRYLERERSDRTTRIALGRALVRLGRCGEGVTELAATLGRDGSRAPSASVAIDLARCYDRLQRADLALATYESVTRLDPRAKEAKQIVAQRRKDAEEAPLRRAYAAIELKDNATAVLELGAYLESHPRHAEARLQLARVHSWASEFEAAARNYEIHLTAHPDDSAARRELAQVFTWRGLVPDAVKQYEALAEKATDPGRAVIDLETVLTLQTQAGDFPSAESTAAKILRLRPEHETAGRILEDAATRRKTAAREAAQTLTAQSRYAEAIAAYGKYEETYGPDPEVALLVSRLHSWAREYPAAITAYRAYLKTRPDDTAARSELATVLSWTQKTAEAETEYRTILSARPDDTEASLRLVQIEDQRGGDRVRVLEKYEGILVKDPGLTEARHRAAALRRAVAPQPRILANRFTDSDDLDRTWTTFEVDFLRAGRTSIIPIAGYLRSEQSRLVQSETLEAVALNREIGERRGTVQGGGLGLRLETRPRGWTLLTEAMVLALDTDRTSVNGRFDISYDHGADKPGVALQYLRREAVHDLASGAAMIAGVVGDTVLASTWRGFGKLKTSDHSRLRVWIAGGASFFSGGAEGAFRANRQDRVSARMSLHLNPHASVAYVGRYSRFRERSPLYYSPQRDITHLLAGWFETRGKKVRVALAVEGGTETIDGQRITPLLIEPSLEFRSERMPVRLLYRYGRSGASAFGSSTYIAQTLELTIGARR